MTILLLVVIIGLLGVILFKKDKDSPPILPFPNDDEVTAICTAFQPAMVAKLTAQHTQLMVVPNAISVKITALSALNPAAGA